MNTKSLILVVAITAVLGLTCDAALKEGHGKQKAIAASYFEALFSGDVKKANELSKTPFSLDRKRVLKKKGEVEEAHRKIAEDKGRRKIPDYTISLTDKAPKLDREVFPDYVAYRISVGGEHIDIYVSNDGSQKVIGFSD